MERLLHYVWKYRLYSPTSLVTTCGMPVEVIDPGLPNADAGPDFFNAKVKLDGTLWAGSVEIHDRASDWMLHKHDTNKAYDSVILHLTGLNDREVCRTNGEPIPQLVLAVPEAVRQNMEWLLHRDVAIPCLHQLHEVDALHLSHWMDALLSERLERKTQDIFRLLEQTDNDWNEVFYITLTRNFGFGVNGDAFERLAKSLPLRYIRKQRGSSSQVEALFFGQAGLLDDEVDCHYYRLLQREYRFLSHKFQLTPLDGSLFRSLRLRPGNLPHLKLAQLAALWMQHDTLFSAILEARTPGDVKAFFRVPPSDYWLTHYHFRATSAAMQKPLGESAILILLINTIVPMLFAYGQRNKLPEFCERATRLLERIPPEQNTIVSAFAQAGVPIQHAGDSQSLIQLKREYCEKKRCLFCRIGFRLIKRSNLPTFVPVSKT